MSFMRKSDEKPKKTATSAPRPKVRPVWRETWFLAILIALITGGLAGGAWWTVASGTAERTVEKVRWSAIAVTAQMGFRVQEVMVSGRKKTSRDTLLQTLNVDRGAPILAFDIEEAKQRIEGLPWIRATTVERMLPDTILVSIEEREPLALWQLDKKLHLVDAEGIVILDKGLEPYADLLMVVGDGAQTRAAELLALLGSAPELMNLVRAATWVGNRRWNLHLHGGIDVRLPETDADAAWDRLAQYHKSHRVLDKNVTVLDLRIPDRLIVRTGPKDDGQET